MYPCAKGTAYDKLTNTLGVTLLWSGSHKQSAGSLHRNTWLYFRRIGGSATSVYSILMANLKDLCQSVVTGNVTQVKEQTQTLVDAGNNLQEIINDGLIAGMNVVGPRFKNGEMFVPEVLMCAKAMAAGMEIVKPLISDKDMPSKGTIVLGTVEGDLHDIGKNLVGMMLEGAGFKVVDIGIDIAPKTFIEAVKEHNPQIVAMSALLTTTMVAMKNTIDLINEEGLKVKCIVGGAPVSQGFADEIGADGYAADAASAAELCAELVG
jgi:5-methyltetrahydrofolate--homocysteine methyltransferase